MGKIRILPEHEARKVAAGEVVERPANIVKELVENSLDARAKTISIYVKKAGKELIRVVDDGGGMSASDAALCVQPHATSKIKTIDDLLSIATFGFRGEALPSIAAVSNFSLKTWDGGVDEGIGTNITVSYGQCHTSTPVNCPHGTDISIENLFENIPVRKKFLKQDETEWNQIVNLVEAFSLSHMTIHFKLFNDNGLVLNLPPVQNVKDRIAQCWGYNFAENMIEFSYQENKHSWVTIRGYISNHNFWRYNRSTMFFFVNNRWVKYQELSKAVMKGYNNVLPPGKFPAVFFFIDADADQVDVNVHPKKEEVRFVYPLVVYKMLEQGVKNSLEKLLTSKVSFTPASFSQPFLEVFFDGGQNERVDVLDANLKEQKEMAGGSDVSTIKNLSDDNAGEIFKNFFSAQKATFSREMNSDPSCAHPEELHSSILKEVALKKYPEFHQNATIEPIQEDQERGIFVGQLFNTYLLLEQKGELVFIDQHAAHERIMYERFKNIFGKNEGTQLLFPVTMTMAENDITTLLDHAGIFALYGIEIDQAGKNSLVIKSTPSGLKNDCLVKELILETVSFIQENSLLEEHVLSTKITEHVHSQMACKAAVKAGDVLSQEQAQQLLKDLSVVENRFICAHGRPTTWSLAKRDIEKNFKRC